MKHYLNYQPDELAWDTSFPQWVLSPTRENDSDWQNWLGEHPEKVEIVRQARTMMYGGSGISILTPFDSDANTGYKNVVRNNTCYSNKTTIPWISEQRLSDGNGIIIDVNKRPYNSTVTDKPYKGRTLVENNVSFSNGGSGIHAFDAIRVDIINNTTYNNAQVMVNYADLYANTCDDVKFSQTPADAVIATTKIQM